MLEAGLVSVTMPDQVGLAAAVAQPALAVGLDFEPGLVERIVRDLDDQPGGLPLLQYAMTELVEQRTSDVLTFAAYESIGGVYGALGKRPKTCTRRSHLRAAVDTAGVSSHGHRGRGSEGSSSTGDSGRVGGNRHR